MTAVVVIDIFYLSIMTGKTSTIHLVIEQGLDKGKEIAVPPEGVRLGRSSKNDIVLLDPLLSRHHCRLFFKTGDGLWVTDLGSANHSVVNDAVIQESRLRVGDRLAVGNTVLAVRNDGITDVADKKNKKKKKDPAGAKVASGPVVDLGLAVDDTAQAQKKLGTKPLVMIGVLVTIVALAAWLPKLLPSKPTTSVRPIVTVKEEPDTSLEIDYEKVEADTENIFRYKLTIDKNNVLAIEIDDLANNRRVGEKKPVSVEYIQNLSRAIAKSGFFRLAEEYIGVQPGVFHQWDLQVTIGRKTHRTTVKNRPEPEIFKEVREKIEVFGKNELGLWAVQFPVEELIQMSRNAFLQGKKLYDEREIKYGNLCAAIKSFLEADIHLRTVEAKPEFYGDILACTTDCKEELKKRYHERNFRADHAIKLREWDRAAEELRILCEMIPDRDDPRNREARAKLLEVESRIDTKRR